ncbi:hypothetical protein [Cochleicola gelatinilyticus]|uniref:Glycosyltransferase RgtA/B/C/D-like domain-containing protein n=1 Tax=Cochleicola gelatinilyticus TaxID=1763537 RepID=A0A167KEP5_9FLAO|nr:hypothetical protein [Cochleicola gelatinilyticus]OAB81812.1 hypothetical protein ULVI_00290 [Cochleicola gelatinilyticus]
MTLQNKNTVLRGIIYGAVFLLFAVTAHNSFFWDTVQLGSKHAHFFLGSNFSELLLPDSLDSGHIPVFGFYLAVLWSLFGKTLLISHLAMLPFIFGLLWQLELVCRYFFPKKYSVLVVLLLLLDPTLLSQLTLISPDVPLIFFFLLGVNSVLKNNKKLLTLSILLLFLISLRGMMVSLCLLSLDLYCTINFRAPLKEIARNLLKRSVLYLPALGVFLAFSTYHFYVKGWIGYHEESPWAKSFARVPFSGFLYNIGILFWRLFDFGRIIIWILLFTLFALKGRAYIKDEKIKLVVYFLLSTLLILPINMLWAKDLLAHRYLLPIYLIAGLLAALLLFSPHTKKAFRNIFLVGWVVILISGNLWIYPEKISQGWDSTLAHLPYYSLRKQSLSYLAQNEIDLAEVASFFPNTSRMEMIDLNEDLRFLNGFDGHEKYVVYSNVFNISDVHHALLQTDYQPLQRFENCGVYFVIFQKK